MESDSLDNMIARARTIPQGEALNFLSHGLGFLAALAATPILIYSAARGGGAADVVASSIFGASLILLYLASSWYHALHPGPGKDRLQKVDHAAIYVLIAGSYTPFTLGVLEGAWGWALFSIVWAAALLGVAAKFTIGMRFPRLSTTMYLVMGWLAIIAIRPLYLRSPLEGLIWLAAGGLFYSAGVIFYVRDTRHSHFIWHLFVLAGSTCHFFAVLWYAR
ncbi:MAG: hemolysin III [Rhodothermales bacterium]